MFGRRTSLFLFVLVGICCAHATLARAQEAASTEQNANSDRNQPYNLASINGEYAFVGTYGANVGRQLGIAHFRDGQVSGSGSDNIPGATPTERVLTHFSFTGTITVNDDGTGFVTLTVTFTNNTKIQVHIDILITKARELHGRKIALEIQDSQREVANLATPQFAVHTLTRRPD